MKKLLFLLPLLFFIVTAKGVVFAQTVTPTAIPSPTPMINYTLPYPGILPDNPLYILKVARDRLVDFFIADPLKKSQFSLLQSDKRIEAAWYLFKEGQSKDTLALSTLSKSTNYLFDALSQAKQADSMGEDVADLKGQLHDATAKHREIVFQMFLLPGMKNNATLMEESKRLEDLQEVVSSFSSQ